MAVGRDREIPAVSRKEITHGELLSRTLSAFEHWITETRKRGKMRLEAFHVPKRVQTILSASQEWYDSEIVGGIFSTDSSCRTISSLARLKRA